MKPLIRIHWPLALLKVLIVLGAVGLDLAGRLSPQSAPIILTLVAALGLTHVAALLKNPPVSAETIGKLGDLVVQMMNTIGAFLPPAPASSSRTSTPASSSTSPASAIVVPPLALVALGLGSLSCAATGPTQADVAAYARAQFQCDVDYSTRPTIDACRAAYRAAFCERFPGQVVCPSSSSSSSSDGGTNEGG